MFFREQTLYPIPTQKQLFNDSLQYKKHIQMPNQTQKFIKTVNHTTRVQQCKANEGYFLYTNARSTFFLVVRSLLLIG